MAGYYNFTQQIDYEINTLSDKVNNVQGSNKGGKIAEFSAGMDKLKSDGDSFRAATERVQEKMEKDKEDVSSAAVAAAAAADSGADANSRDNVFTDSQLASIRDAAHQRG